jgi:inorganic pyrophosphatase
MMKNTTPQFKAHPWHGVSIGSGAPKIVQAYIEITPSDGVKYEIDKETGHLKVDRPQKYSNHCPTLYGFIPQTFCGEAIGKLCEEKANRIGIKGDGDPLDICVITEKLIVRGDILLKALPIGGLRMIDNNEADDKIIAVMENDTAFGHWKNISDCPKALIDRLTHYFLTYKDIPGTTARKVEIDKIYDAEEAYSVILASCKDYRDSFLN